MRNFSKKLAFVLAAAMVFTAFAPAAKADAAEKMVMNRASQTLYVNEGVNDKGAETLPEGLYGNVQEYDFYVKNKPATYAKEYNFLWESDNEKVATVDQKGLTKAVAVGTATITCTITDKATDDEVAVAEAKVTVKANAADVVISNADEYEDFVVADVRVIDLNRDMYDEDGNKTNKRGKFVTDYTKWVAKFGGEVVDATVVAIDQATGKFTFAEDAPAGEYELYCQTYQSEKYSQATATSDPVVVTVEEAKVEIDEIVQDTVTDFTVKFTKKLDKLGAVKVEKIYKSGDFAIPFEQGVEKAELAKDGMSATVKLFGQMGNGNEFVVTVEGFEAEKFVSSQGAPEDIKFFVDGKYADFEIEPVYYGTTASTLSYKLYDAKGVDVTSVAGGTVLFNAVKYATDGSYYVSGDQIWFAKEGVGVDVEANYQSGEYKDGVQVGCFKAYKSFVSEKKPEVKITGVVAHAASYNTIDWTKAVATSVPYTSNAVNVEVKVAFSEGDPKTYKAGDTLPVGGTVEFQVVNPDVAAMNGSSLFFFKQGTSKLIVNRVYTNSNNQVVTESFGYITVDATAPIKFKSASLDKYALTLGTVSPYDFDTIKVSAINNYDQGYALGTADVVVTAVSEDAKKVANADGVVVSDVLVPTVDDKGVVSLTFYGAKLIANEAFATKDTVQLTFKATVNKDNIKIEETFNILVKRPGKEGTEYLNLVVDGFNKNIARTVDSKDAKVGTFTAFKMSNGIKIGTYDLKKYVANAAVSEGQYYVAVTKNGTDVTNTLVKDADLAAGKVVVNFSGYGDAVTVSGSAINPVTYANGAGTYVFTLYKGVKISNTQVIAAQQSFATGAVTCDAGKYGNAVKVKDSVTAVTEKALRDAFSIKDTKGNESAALYKVSYNDKAAGFVYVDKITFYDDLGNGAYAAYEVKVDQTLAIKPATN